MPVPELLHRDTGRLISEPPPPGQRLWPFRANVATATVGEEFVLLSGGFHHNVSILGKLQV